MSGYWDTLFDWAAEDEVTDTNGHGTVARYVSGCRCRTCKEANSQYQKAYKLKRKEIACKLAASTVSAPTQQA
jgi:hypothetical protein